MSDSMPFKGQSFTESIARLFKNGVTAGAWICVPNLACLNEMRAEYGLEPITREQVPENIHFANEMVLDAD